MLIRYGFDIEISVPQRTAVIAAMDVHPSHEADIVRQSEFVVDPPADMETFRDCHGNIVRRLSAPAGNLSMRRHGVLNCDGLPDLGDESAEAWPVADLPHEVLPFLLGSRYCETDHLSAFAWRSFGAISGGWSKVQAICDFVHRRLSFSYALARATRTAVEAMDEGVGVCRDYAHLAITLCRCLNIPARYCNGFLGDIGVPPDPAPMDFNAWFEAFLGGRWHTFDARHNRPRIGRILIARGRDATDVPMIMSFGPHRLERFVVVTEEVPREKKMIAA